MTKKLIVLMIVFALMVFSAEVPFPVTPHAGTQADPEIAYATPTLTMRFNDTYTAKSVIISKIDCELANSAGTVVGLVSWTSGWSITDGAFYVPFAASINALPNAVYQAKIRVWDDAGNISVWSDIMWFKKNWITLDKPGGCKLMP